MDPSNSFRESIEAGQVCLGARTSSFSPALVEIYGDLGLDFVWLDFEHAGASPWNSVSFEHLTRAAEAGGIELLVRLPNSQPSLIRKVLDAGVRNLLIPRVKTAEEVRQAVEATRFVHDGKPGERGIAHGRASDYGTADRYPAQEDDSVCVGVMIEEATAVDNISDILSVSDLGFAFIGPGDLAVQLGQPGEREHPDVQRAISEVETACHDANIPLGGNAHDPQKADEKIQNGYQIIRLGGEFESARQVLRSRMERLNEFQVEE